MARLYRAVILILFNENILPGLEWHPEDSNLSVRFFFCHGGGSHFQEFVQLPCCLLLEQLAKYRRSQRAHDIWKMPRRDARRLAQRFQQLLYSNCVPKLTFGAEVKELSSSEINQFNVAVNTAVRRIFGFRYWQSIRQIREVYGYNSIEALYGKARKRFLDGMNSHNNETEIFGSLSQRGWGNGTELGTLVFWTTSISLLCASVVDS